VADDGKTAPQQPAAIAAAQATIRPPEGAPVASGPPPMPADWRYDLHGEIARGGMGRVVDATDTVLGRSVALKEALARDADSIRRFHRETRITAKLEHPSIVPVHDAGTSPSGAPFYVMRKVSGRPLEDLIRAAEPLADRLALLPNIVAAAHAIAHAHGRGVVHRDIKPSNILVGENGETIVIDWGLAKVIGETEEARATPHVADDGPLKTRAGIVYGTPGFIAPEQLRGAPVDERSDVYALGATLYHLLARKPPHHAATGHAMIEAAVSGPPTPLRDLVAGVPPELATIVDKALAFDANTRYRNAAALAEDLNRFLTGQLVASHHYSTREKLVRWVRRNRALVAVTSAALVAMIVGAWIAIGRIVDERDLAQTGWVEEQKQRQAVERERVLAIERADNLTITQAETEVDPTRAIAMLKSLGSRRIQEVRAIAAKARAGGVAFGLPASPRAVSLEFARDGHHLVAAGDDGKVRVYDLAAHAVSLELQIDGATAARFADDDRRVAIAHGDSLAIVEIATAARREIAAKGAIDKLAVSGTIAYWIDPQHAVWTVDVAAKDAAPARLALDDSIDRIVPSPDGRWIALAGAEQLLLLDRTQPTLPPEALLMGNARELTWDADGHRLAALLNDYVYDVKPAASPQAAPQNVGHRDAVAYANGRVYTSGATGIDSARRGDYTLGLHEAQRGVLIAGGAKEISVLSETTGDRVLHAPIAPLSRVESSPRSPYVVAAADGRLLVWQLDTVVPLHVASEIAATGADFIDGDHVVIAYGGAPAKWRDLRDGKATELESIANLRSFAPAPDGSRAIAIDLAKRARVIAPGAEPIALDGAIDLARFVDAARYVVAKSDGAIVLNDGGAARQLAPAGHRPVALVARGTRVAAAFADGSLWRTDVASGGDGHRSSLKTAPRAIAIADDGTVAIADGKTLRAWRADGALHDEATFSRPLVALAFVPAGGVLAVEDDGHATVVRIGDSAGKPVRWALGGPAGMPYSLVAIAPDGRRALAISPSGVLVWSLAAPEDLDAMTNADASDGLLRWK
jgi:hypothetical protein